jgi:hypothetical protein
MIKSEPHRRNSDLVFFPLLQLIDRYKRGPVDCSKVLVFASSPHKRFVADELR